MSKPIGKMFIIHHDPDMLRRDTIAEIKAIPELETLQKIVGGNIDVIPGFVAYEGAPCVAYCNEATEGRPLNAKATDEWRKQGYYHSLLHGNVVVIQAAPEVLSQLLAPVVLARLTP